MSMYLTLRHAAHVRSFLLVLLRKTNFWGGIVDNPLRPYLLRFKRGMVANVTYAM
jgi:hypothetical protein